MLTQSMFAEAGFCGSLGQPSPQGGAKTTSHDWWVCADLWKCPSGTSDTHQWRCRSSVTWLTCTTTLLRRRWWEIRRRWTDRIQLNPVWKMSRTTTSPSQLVSIRCTGIDRQTTSSRVHAYADNTAKFTGINPTVDRCKSCRSMHYESTHRGGSHVCWIRISVKWHVYGIFETILSITKLISPEILLNRMGYCG